MSSNSTYYEYEDVKVNIAHRLFNMAGWEVIGYKADESDLMTDYYSPAYWGGIAYKGDYTLVVDHSAPQEARTYTVRTSAAAKIDAETAAKIEKLSRMTTDRGATPAEAETAAAKIKALRNKQASAAEGVTEETRTKRGFLANPPRCNWHIERNGVIVAKGTGLLKYARVPDISNEYTRREWQEFNTKTREQWIADEAAEFMRKWNYTEERAKDAAASNYEDAAKCYKLLDDFNILMNKIDTAAGGMMAGGDDSGYTYEMKKVTKYKKVKKAQETPTGEIKEGQCFILKSSFNYGCYKGLVYKIIKSGTGYLTAYKLNKKLEKVCTGTADNSNHFMTFYKDDDRDCFNAWIAKGAIAWVDVVEVSEAYEVEQAVKVDADGNEIKNARKKSATSADNATKPETETAATTDYEIIADTDTRDGSPLWVVKLTARVDTETFSEIRDVMKQAGGYYSRFKKGFIFKFNPADVLNHTGDEETAETGENERENDTTPEQETPPTEYGYKPDDESDRLFTMGAGGDLDTLNKAGILKQGTTGYIASACGYIGLKYVYDVRLSGDAIAGRPDLFGYLINGERFIRHRDAIIQSAYNDIETELQRLTADITTAAELTDSRREYVIRQFVKGEPPVMELLCESYLSCDHSRLIAEYLLRPAATVEKYAADYLREHADEVKERREKHNALMAEYDRIENDHSHSAHTRRRIKNAIPDTAKTCRIITTDGRAATVTDASRMAAGMACNGYIWNYYIKYDDGIKAHDLPAEDIAEITYKGKTLYHAPKTATKSA